MFSLINRGRRLLSGAPLQLSPPGRGLGFLEGFSLRALSVSLRWEERGGRGGVLVAADAAGTIGIGRLALPALLGILDNIDILGGGISRLTKGIAPSHWRQPYPLPGWGEMERGCFYLFTLLPFYL